MAVTMNDIRTKLSEKGSMYHNIACPLSDDPKKWAKEAKMSWTIESSPLLYKVGDEVKEDPRRKFLYRSDTLAPLAPVGTDFKVVQPADIVEFFGTLSSKWGFKLELAGQGLGGRRIWGLASTPLTFGKGDETVANYLLLSTANDGTMSTRGFFTAFRLRCTNQLPMLNVMGAEGIAGGRGARNRVGNVGRVVHSREFDIDHMAEKIDGLKNEWKNFTGVIEKLQSIKVNDYGAQKFFMTLCKKEDDGITFNELSARSIPAKMFETYTTDETTIPLRGTGWGLVNAVTRYLDHGGKEGNGQHRVDRVWLGGGRKTKEEAVQLALNMAA